MGLIRAGPDLLPGAPGRTGSVRLRLPVVAQAGANGSPPLGLLASPNEEAALAAIRRGRCLSLS